MKKQCLCLVLAVFWASAVLAGVSLDAPGHVYVEGTTLTISNAPADSIWMLTDWLGRELTNAQPSTLNPQLSNLSVGYYHLRCESEDITFAVVPKPEKRTFDKNSFYGVGQRKAQLFMNGMLKKLDAQIDATPDDTLVIYRRNALVFLRSILECENCNINAKKYFNF